MPRYTDKQLLDFLQLLTNRRRNTGKVVIRESSKGGGWRLMETANKHGVKDVRQAITRALDAHPFCTRCHAVDTKLMQEIDGIKRPSNVNTEYRVFIFRCLKCGHNFSFEKRLDFL